MKPVNDPSTHVRVLNFSDLTLLGPVARCARLAGAKATEARDTLTHAELTEEIGDLFFVMANLARKLDVDPEAALAGTLLKFRRRFAHVERSLAERGRHLADATLEEMDALWDEAKRNESKRP